MKQSEQINLNEHTRHMMRGGGIAETMEKEIEKMKM